MVSCAFRLLAGFGKVARALFASAPDPHPLFLRWFSVSRGVPGTRLSCLDVAFWDPSRQPSWLLFFPPW